MMLDDFQISIIGYMAAILTSGVNIPIAYKTLKTQDIESLNIYTIMIQLFASALWLVYGKLKNDIPILSLQIVMTCINLFILYCYFRYNFPKAYNKYIDKKEY